MSWFVQEMMEWQEFFLLAAPRVKIKIPFSGDLLCQPLQHRQQQTSDYRSFIAADGYCPNDNRRRTICSGGFIVAAAPISPQIPIHAKYSKNEGNLCGKWVQRPQ
eukprot:scaffold2388_cov57-Cyclotella_meneghiniana.AAC.7